LFQFRFDVVLILFDQNKTKLFYYQFCSPKQNKITKNLPKLAKQNKTKIKMQMLSYNYFLLTFPEVLKKVVNFVICFCFDFL
jgi:hypothetical protein